MAVIERKDTNSTAVNGTRITVTNPVSGAIIGAVPAATSDEVTTAVERARLAQRSWGALDARERARILRRWGDLLWARRSEIMRVIRDETGKNETGAFLEVLVLETLVSYYSHHAPRILRPQRRAALLPLIQKGRVYYKPYGVVGCITPWNYPLLNALLDLVPALYAGNTAILKPSEIAPFSAMRAVELMHEAGVPADVVQVVTGAGDTGAALVERVDYVAFTGSTSVGREIAVRAAERLIPYTLELGGKDPLIILNDADVELAAAGVLKGALENAGQVCISTERVYAEAGIYERFVERLLHYAHQLSIGADDGFEVHVGSMTNEREVQRCEAQIEDAVRKGARVVFGGKRRPDLGPLFFEPTILVDVDHTMQIMQDETFGPLIPVMRVADAQEAVRLANDSIYGLSGAIFTKDLRRGQQLARQIESGDICINRTQILAGTHSMPWGGFKASGVGRRGGPEGLLRFVATQSIVTDNLFGQKPALTLADPLSLRIMLLLRVLRRYIPFI